MTDSTDNQEVPPEADDLERTAMLDRAAAEEKAIVDEAVAEIRACDLYFVIVVPDNGDTLIDGYEKQADFLDELDRIINSVDTEQPFATVIPFHGRLMEYSKPKKSWSIRPMGGQELRTPIPDREQVYAGVSAVLHPSEERIAAVRARRQPQDAEPEQDAEPPKST